MKHSYLSTESIIKALDTHAITKNEAKKLMKKVDCQVFIFRTTH